MYKCLYCHATAFPSAVLKNVSRRPGDRGIGCEHSVWARWQSSRGRANPVCRTRRSSPCRRLGRGLIELRPVPWPSSGVDASHDDPFWIRFQATTLAWSCCSIASNGTLDCIICHDPHRTPEQSAAYYETKCLACYSRQSPSAIFAGAAKKAAGQPPSRSSRETPVRLVTRSVCPVMRPKAVSPATCRPTISAPLHADFARSLHPRTCRSPRADSDERIDKRTVSWLLADRTSKSSTGHAILYVTLFGEFLRCAGEYDSSPVGRSMRRAKSRLRSQLHAEANRWSICPDIAGRLLLGCLFGAITMQQAAIRMTWSRQHLQSLRRSPGRRPPRESIPVAKKDTLPAAPEGAGWDNEVTCGGGENGRRRRSISFAFSFSSHIRLTYSKD